VAGGSRARQRARVRRPEQGRYRFCSTWNHGRPEAPVRGRRPRLGSTVAAWVAPGPRKRARAQGPGTFHVERLLAPRRH